MPDTMSRVRDWHSAAGSNPLFTRALIAAFVLAVVDQLTKWWVVGPLNLPDLGQIELSPIFDLTFVQNRGASFGMLAGGMGSRILLSAISIGVATGLIIWLARLHRKWAAVGIAFVVGGAIGNLIDRVRLGYVIDFLDFSGLYFPWVFNVADVCINVGIAFLLLDMVLEGRNEKNNG